MGYLSATGIFLYYLLFPIALLLSRILFVLSIITAPLVHLGHYVLYACWYPIHILGKFETLYIFFGVAALVGVLTGTSLHYVSAFIGTLLNLDRGTQEPRGRSLASYRMEKKDQQQKNASALPLARPRAQARIDVSPKDEYTDWLGQHRGNGKRSLISTTILEEDDSSEAGF